MCYLTILYVALKTVNIYHVMIYHASAPRCEVEFSVRAASA